MRLKACPRGRRPERESGRAIPSPSRRPDRTPYPARSAPEGSEGPGADPGAASGSAAEGPQPLEMIVAVGSAIWSRVGSSIRMVMAGHPTPAQVVGRAAASYGSKDRDSSVDATGRAKGAGYGTGRPGEGGGLVQAATREARNRGRGPTGTPAGLVVPQIGPTGPRLGNPALPGRPAGGVFRPRVVDAHKPAEPRPRHRP